jgi:hypothetical protein
LCSREKSARTPNATGAIAEERVAVFMKAPFGLTTELSRAAGGSQCPSEPSGLP